MIIYYLFEFLVLFYKYGKHYLFSISIIVEKYLNRLLINDKINIVFMTSILIVLS